MQLYSTPSTYGGGGAGDAGDGASGDGASGLTIFLSPSEKKI